MIYDKNSKEIRKELIKFGKTIYGKSIFLICYTPFLMSLITLIITYILFLRSFYVLYAVLFIITILITTFAFCIGSYFYYKELRIYIEKKK